MKNRALWERLGKVDFDQPEAGFSFTDRLARDNGWSREFSCRVIEEYRKFVYLAKTAGHEVTPSDEVDQAWHLHLTYTRHYWGEFTNVLGEPLHHGPTTGGKSEKVRYSDNYSKTVESYIAAFNEAPPEDIWPNSVIRFGHAPFMQRVNTQQYYLLEKSKILLTAHRAAVIVSSGVVVFAGAAALAASTGSTQPELIQSLLQSPLFKGGIALLILGIIVLGLGHQARSKKNSADKSGGAAGGAVIAEDSNGDADGGSGCGSGCGGGCGG